MSAPSCPAHYTRRVCSWAGATQGGAEPRCVHRRPGAALTWRQQSGLDTRRQQHRAGYRGPSTVDRQPLRTCPVPAVPGGDPVSRLPALPARGPATRQHLQPAASPPAATISSNADVASRSVTARSWGSPEVHTQRKGPKPWEKMSLKRQMARHLGLAGLGLGSAWSKVREAADAPELTG